MLESIFSNAWAVALVVLFFGGSIFVHELGHFLAAKWRGLHIVRFSIGFGPSIVSWRRKGVEYRLSWIPLGGYVALPQLADLRSIEGESDADLRELPPIGYADKMIVAAAGAVFNVVFAFLLACVLWAVKQPVGVEERSTTIGYVFPVLKVPRPDGSTETVPSPAADAGLAIGDTIKTIDGRRVEDWKDIVNAIVTGSGWAGGRRMAVVEIERGGTTLQKVVHPIRLGDERIRQIGIVPACDVLVQDVPAGSRAGKFGLRAGDRLVSMGGQPIRSAQHYAAMLREQRRETLALVVRREGAEVSITLPPRPFPVVTGVVRDSVAQRLGLRFGDELAAIDGTPVGDDTEFRAAVQARTAAPFTLTIRRGGAPIDLAVPARPDKSPLGIEFGHLLGESLAAEVAWVRIPPLRQCANVVVESWRNLSSLVNPRSDLGLSMLSGPIEIVRVYHIVAKAGFRYVLWFTIAINIGLAVFNLLPIPVLDGGHMLFATIAKIRRRPVPIPVLAATQSVFMMLLLAVFLYVSWFNVRRWVRDAGRARAEESMLRAPEAPTPP